MTETEIAVYVMTFLSCYLLQIILIPVFIHRFNKGKKYKVIQMISSSLFIAAGVIAPYAFQDKITTKGIIALGGLIAAWVGDLLSRKDKNNKTDSARLIAYTVTNIAYIVAFSLQNYNKPKREYGFDVYEIPVFIAVMGLFFLTARHTKPALYKKVFPVIYAVTFSVLSARSVSLAVYNIKMYPQMSVAVLIGTVGMLISGIAVMLNRYGNKNSKGLNRLGIAAHYIAQNAFALFIGIIPLGWTGQISLMS